MSFGERRLRYWIQLIQLLQYPTFRVTGRSISIAKLFVRVLAVDPGAERCGWAVLDDGPKLVQSGILRTPREDMEYQDYRLYLEIRSLGYFDNLLYAYQPDLVVNEIIPAVGGGNFVVATQSYLANCVVTCLHACAYREGMKVEQISARTVQSKIAVRGKSKKITKVQVRNGVIAHLPELKSRVSDLVADESDAIAIGLVALGVTTGPK